MRDSLKFEDTVQVLSSNGEQSSTWIMAFPVVEFSRQGYKIRKSTVFKWNYQILRIGVMASCRKLGMILVINSFKNWFYQKMSITTNVLLNWYSSMKKKIQKDSDDFWHRKLTLKVKFWYFLTAPHYSNFQNLVISFEYSWFLAKSLSNFVSLPWKLHNRECHNGQCSVEIIRMYNTYFWNKMIIKWYEGIIAFRSTDFWLFLIKSFSIWPCDSSYDTCHCKSTTDGKIR